MHTHMITYVSIYIFKYRHRYQYTSTYMIVKLNMYIYIYMCIYIKISMYHLPQILLELLPPEAPAIGMFPFLPEGLIQGRQHGLVDGDLVLGDHRKQVGSRTHKWRRLPGRTQQAIMARQKET